MAFAVGVGLDPGLTPGWRRHSAGLIQNQRLVGIQSYLASGGLLMYSSASLRPVSRISLMSSSGVAAGGA